MLDFSWIHMSLFLLLKLHITETADDTSILKRVGEDVTLSCEDLIKDQNNCDATTWNFGRPQLPTVELINLGQIGEYAKTQSDRLSFTSDCSLIIKKVTEEDVGWYDCLQYKTKNQQKPEHQSSVVLSVVDITEHENSDNVKLVCTVHPYHLYSHTVKWLYNSEEVDKIQSNSDSSATLTFADKTHFIYQSRRNLLKCEVTDKNSKKVQHFGFKPQTPGGIQPTNPPPITEKEKEDKPDSSGLLMPIIIVVVGLVTVLILVVLVIRWKKGNKQTDENTGLSLNTTVTPSAAENSDFSADPDEGVSYVSINHIRTTRQNARVQDVDEEVTYSTVKAPSSSSSTAGASADPNNLYATVNFTK